MFGFEVTKHVALVRRVCLLSQLVLDTLVLFFDAFSAQALPTTKGGFWHGTGVGPKLLPVLFRDESTELRAAWAWKILRRSLEGNLRTRMRNMFNSKT